MRVAPKITSPHHTRPIKFKRNLLIFTVEPVLKDLPIEHKYMASQDRWSLVAGSITLECRTFCQEYVVLQDCSCLSWQWSLKTGFTVIVGPESPR